jgi:hypothetical protein
MTGAVTTVSMPVWGDQAHDYSPSDIFEWRMSCSNTTSLNLQPSIKSAPVGLAPKLRATWNGWKSTVTLGPPCFAGYLCYFILPSSFRREAAQRYASAEASISPRVIADRSSRRCWATAINSCAMFRRVFHERPSSTRWFR